VALPSEEAPLILSFAGFGKGGAGLDLFKRLTTTSELGEDRIYGRGPDEWFWAFVPDGQKILNSGPQIVRRRRRSSIALAGLDFPECPCESLCSKRPESMSVTVSKPRCGCFGAPLASPEAQSIGPIEQQERIEIGERARGEGAIHQETFAFVGSRSREQCGKSNVSHFEWMPQPRVPMQTRGDDFRAAPERARPR
jgi:hypothetical protein